MRASTCIGHEQMQASAVRGSRGSKEAAAAPASQADGTVATAVEAAAPRGGDERILAHQSISLRSGVEDSLGGERGIDGVVEWRVRRGGRGCMWMACGGGSVSTTPWMR